MKPTTLLLLMMLLASSAFAQKKGKVDPKDVRIDSLRQVTHALTLRLDSVSKELAVYHSVYETVKTKVFKYDYEPQRTGELIDSLRTHRDATFSGLNANATALADTVAQLRASIATTNDQAAQKATAIADLKALKELLDQKIITQEEFDTRKARLVEKL